MRRDKSLVTNTCYALNAMLPRVSIVLPTYNGTKYLAQSIQSVIDQTLTAWELIVVDDASAEDAYGIAAAFGDPRIHYVRNGANCRLPRSLNRGFALAAGQYLTWTSDDNWYAPDALEKMAQVLDSSPRVAMVRTDMWRVDEHGNKKLAGLDPPLWLASYNCIGACFLYRRIVLETVGLYDHRYALVEDYEYWLRVASRFAIASVVEPLYYYRIHSSSLTGQSAQGHIESLAAAVRAEPRFCRLQRRLRMYWRLVNLRRAMSRRRIWKSASLGVDSLIERLAGL